MNPRAGDAAAAQAIVELRWGLETLRSKHERVEFLPFVVVA